MSKYDPKPPNINPSESPHGIHIPKQGNPCLNSKNNSQPLHNKMTYSENYPTTPPKLPVTSPISKPNPKPPNIALCNIPTGATAQNRVIPAQTSKQIPIPLQIRRPTQ